MFSIRLPLPFPCTLLRGRLAGEGHPPRIHVTFTTFTTFTTFAAFTSLARLAAGAGNASVPLAHAGESDFRPLLGETAHFPFVAHHQHRLSVRILREGGAVRFHQALQFGRLVGAHPARDLVGARLEAELE